MNKLTRRILEFLYDMEFVYEYFMIQIIELLGIKPNL